MKMTRILDCDPGNSVPRANVDDSLTIAVLAGLLPARHIDQIVTVFGNTPAEIGYDCAKQLLSTLGFEVSVRCGATAPLAGNADYWADFLHHPPIPFVDRKAADLSVYRDADVIAIGPLTNVANAIHQGFIPRHVYMMGGAIGFDELVDTNFAVDPVAAYQVFVSAVPMTVVPLDITRQTCLSLQRWNGIRDALREKNPRIAQAIDSWLRPWIEYSQRTRPVNGMWVHDLVALVAYLSDWGGVDESILTTSQVRMKVDEGTGKLSRNNEGRVAWLASSINNDRLIDFLEQAILAL